MKSTLFVFQGVCKPVILDKLQKLKKQMPMEEQTKEQLLARIRELEAQVRSLNNSIIDRKDEYGLRWIDVPEAFDA